MTISLRLLRWIERKANRALTRALSKNATPYVNELTEAYTSGWSNNPCVFVLSTGRVGTQTLTDLLALSPHVYALHEPAPRLIKASFDAYLDGDRVSSREWQALVLAARDDAVYSANKRGQIYVETNNRLTFLAPALAAAFPQSKFIHLYRHPYDVVRSGMRRQYYRGHAWDDFRTRPRPSEAEAERWPQRSALEKCAWGWARTNQFALDFSASLAPQRSLRVSAEQLFAADEPTLQAVYAFVGIAMPSATARNRVLGRKLNAQRNTSYPQPGEWSAQDIDLVNAQVSGVAAVLGYTLATAVLRS